MTDKKNPLRLLYLTVILVCVGSNALVVVYFQTLLVKLVPLVPQQSLPSELNWSTALWGLVFGVILPFLVPTLIINSYMLPMASALNTPRGTAPILSPKAIRRFQNYPLVCALVGMAGWCVAFLTTIAVAFEPEAFGGYLLQFSGAAALTFVFIYFVLEVLNRKLYLPHAFPQGVPIDTPGVVRISIRSSFLLFSFATSFFPLLLLGGSLALGAANNPLAATGLWFIGTFLPGALGLTLLVAKFYESPLVEMKAATEQIRQENYDVQVQVTSGDEIGHLGQGINSMAVEIKDKLFIKETFGKTVDPAVRDHLLAGHFDLGGSLQPAAILFSDLRDFTPFSEALPPNRVVSVLNRYFARMNAVVSAHGGFVNKFMGDAVLALFNLPLPHAGYADSALKAALTMQTSLEELNVELRAEGLPSLRMGIGLHAGEVMAGNIGSPQRMEYTVIGDPVNAASRLESLTKDYHVPLLISSELKTLLSNEKAFQIERVGKTTVKGRSRELEVFTVKTLLS